MTDLELECIRRIAAAKSVPADSVTLQTTLESVQVDSLDLVTLSFDLEDQYGIEISEIEMHQIRTAGDVATAVERALLKKQSAAVGKEGAA